jgi:hypothetical protein
MTVRRTLHLILRASLRRVLILCASVALVACDGSSTGPDGSAVFVVDVEGETFRIRLEDSDRIDQARRILRGEEPQRTVTGSLEAGDGGFNDPWSWHLVPETVEFVEHTIELCDGLPSFVEEELDEWLNNVGTYCPWLSEIVAEE